MDINNIDYSNYSIPELMQAKGSIDPEVAPQNFENLTSELEKRKDEIEAYLDKETNTSLAKGMLNMGEHRKALRKVGTLLIILGIIDIGVMIYCITNQISYSSSFNIFAVIAGIFLYRGGLTAARVVAWFMAIMFTLTFAFIISYPFIQPFELLIEQIKLNPLDFLANAIFIIIFLGISFWVYSQLRSHSVLEARREAGLTTGKPKFAFILGSFMPFVLIPVMYMVNYGESGQLVKAKATEAYGEEYNYYINNMHWSSGNVSAMLVAYRESEIIPLYVACKEVSLTNKDKSRLPRLIQLLNEPGNRDTLYSK